MYAPQGAHFCGPVAEDGAAPYKEMAPGTNVFDYTQGGDSIVESLSSGESRHQVARRN